MHHETFREHFPAGWGEHSYGDEPWHVACRWGGSYSPGAARTTSAGRKRTWHLVHSVELDVRLTLLLLHRTPPPFLILTAVFKAGEYRPTRLLLVPVIFLLGNSSSIPILCVPFSPPSHITAGNFFGLGLNVTLLLWKLLSMNFTRSRNSISSSSA